jgi:hypothetical protein
MGFIIIIPFGALAAWAIVAIFRWLRRGHLGRQWWKAYALLACAGLALGIWFAFFMQYKMANTHLEGFPIPVGIASREKPDGPWVQSAIPQPVRIGGMITNLLSGVALCLVPLAVAAFFKENRGRLGPPGGARRS